MKRSIIAAVAALVIALAAAPAFADPHGSYTSATAVGVGVGGGANVSNTFNPSNNNSQGQGQSQRQLQGQFQGQGQSLNNGQQIAPTQKVSIEDVRQAPAVLAPGLTSAGQNVCLGSFSVGVSAWGAGASFGKTVQDDNCRRNNNAAMLIQLGRADAAMRLMMLDPEVKAAVEGADKARTAGLENVKAAAMLPEPEGTPQDRINAEMAAHPARANENAAGN